MSEEIDMDTSLFIRTKGAISRIQKVVDGIKSGIPLLLEGETGTSKTATAKCAAKEINQNAILFNFSSQTTVEDLLGRISKSSDAWSGFSFKKGPFTEAFEKGYCIILDEINLAHETVLQCIESSLDSRTLSLDFSGSEVDKTIQMHPDFHIIATQNPLTSKFSQKRNFLSHKFTSRFQIIKFGEIGQDEFIEIATGLSNNIDSITPEFIKSLVQFHFEWPKNKHSCSFTSHTDTENSSPTNYVFTIREICRTIKSIEKGLTPFESILVNYGSRYNEESKKAMKKLLHSLNIHEEYQFFKSSYYIDYILSNNQYKSETKIVTTPSNSRFYLTQILSHTFSTSFHLLDNYQPILLVGPNGCGKTSVGRWIGDLYTSFVTNKNKDFDDDQEINSKDDCKFFICNPEMTISDIIGRYLPNKQSTSRFSTNDHGANNNYSDAPIEWMYGPVVKAMINGDCLILDQIDTAPSTILERLNSLFDGLGEKDFKFPIQENLENPEVLVDPKFRIIATSSLSGLNDLSPAFLNRFTVVYINEQLNTIGENLPLFIRCISPYASKVNSGKQDINFIANEVTKTLIKDNVLTSLNLSKCVNGFFKLNKRFPEAEKESILKFCFDACIYHTSSIPEMNDNFINILLESLGEDDRKDTEFDVFHFKEAKSTREVMATLVACSVIGLHTILVGKTGTGKTAAAMAFSRMNKFSSKTSSTHIISFNGETQLDELYGYFTIDKGNFDLHQGELSQAMSEGEVFIADELNLADQQIIQSLNVAIEPFSGENIILPVTGSPIQIKEGFFFIGCQNDLTMNGRRPIPESIKKKILCINYPESSQEDLLVLCSSIAKQFNFDRAIPKYTASLIEKMKADPTLRIKPWSLREVRTLFRRIAYFKTKTQDIKGFTALHHASFMLASSYQNYDEMINKIADLVCTAFLQKAMRKSLINDLKSDIKVIKYIDQSYADNDDTTSDTDDDDDDDDDDNKKKQPKDKNKSHYRIKLIKGSLELNITNSQLLDIPENIQTLWRTIFDIYLTTQSEPLLFNGPSGFKTYLSELFSSLAPVIYLHSDSTISSLVGQIALLDRYQAKLSLIEALDDFTGHNVKLKESLNQIKTYLEENDDINEELLTSATDQIKSNVPVSFIPIIDNVAHRLIDIQEEERDIQNNVRVGNRMFSNYISLFKPGLITKSIFCQNSLILKNFAQPSPAVVERFNELLSVTPTLTLFEDTTNTFTTPTNNKIYGFSSVFRIIAICLPPEKRNLSDAMLSRLTEIYIPSYSQDEQENVFKTYLEKQFEYDISLTIKPLSILKQALRAFEKQSFDLNISFRQKIKIIQVANQWQRKFPDMDVLTIYIISIMRCAGGPLPFELKQLLYQIMEETFNPKGELSEFPSRLSVVYQSDSGDDQFYDTYKCTMDVPCLSLINDGDTICSSLTNFTYPNISFMNNKLNEKPNFRFTFSNYDLIDVIFSFSIINYPLIIEGPNGCGKSSAFFYVAECLGVKVIQISISRSTTVEDLFGRFEPNAESENLQFDFKPTAFLNAIDNDRNSGEKCWILIEELHLASPSVIDALEPIFNPQSDHVTLPDGTFVQRGNFFIVGLLSKPLQKQSISNTALYYKVRNYTRNEFTEISKFILESNEYGGITKRICPILSKLYEISASSQIKIPVTPREAHKFVKMMNAATQHPNQNDQLSDIEVSQILFLGRFVEDDLKDSAKEILNQILKDLEFSANEEIPEFTTENGGSTLASKKLSMEVSMRTQSRHNEIDHLTTSERELFEFLILNVQDYSPIIVQGPTASGKTFSIQLFADVLGKNLKVLQMNSEINSSYIAGSYQPSKDLSPNDITELQNALNLLTNFTDLLPEKFRAKIQKNQINDWSPAEFSELKKCVNDLLLESTQHTYKEDREYDDDEDDDDDDNYQDRNRLDDENDISNAREFINKVNSSLLFFNHLNRNDSLIIKALTEGDWLLLDGIESSPSDFLDRLSTLLDDPPIMNLYERGSGYIYSTKPDKSERSQRIHPDFRLFMTYNPVNTSSNNVSPSFLSRCSLFSMSPIDFNLYDSAVVVSGIIEQCYFSFSTPSEVSAKIASFHLKMKDEGQHQLTCRTLIHISREIFYKNKSNRIEQDQLKEIIFNHYFQGHQDETLTFEQSKQMFNDEIDTAFESKVDDELLEKLQKIERNTSKACNSMINIINDFSSQLNKIVNANQEESKQNTELPRFKFNEFLSNLTILQIKDLGQITSYFMKSIKFISKNIHEFTKEQISYLASVITVFDLIYQMKEISTDRELARAQNLFLDSDYIRNLPLFSIALFQIHAFTSLYHRGLYLEEIPEVLINVDFSKNYFQIFKWNELGKPLNRTFTSLKKSPYFAALDLPDDLESFDFTPYKWKDNISPLQQICSSLFKCKKCRYLFNGLMNDLFVFTYTIYKKANINLLNDWINWLGLFFKAFGKINYNISFDEFESILYRWKNASESEIIELMNKIDKIKSIPEGFDFDDRAIQSTNCVKLFEAINDLYEDLKEKFLEITENNKVARDFFTLKEKISKLAEKNDSPLKRPYQLLLTNIESLNQKVSIENYNHINKIFLSINQPSTKKGHRENMFQWPTNQNLGQIEEKRQKILESLISFSIELEKVESLEKAPKWMTLCDLSEPEFLMKEFLETKTISQETIDYYKSLLRAQLLYALFENSIKDKYEYCNTQKIIFFFNQFNDRFNIVEDNWILIAQKLSQTYPTDFCISIPSFKPLDILSLLLNPLTKQKGCIFNDRNVPEQLINDFNGIFDFIALDESVESFDEVSSQVTKIIIEYANENYPNEYRDYLEDAEIDEFNEFIQLVKEKNILSDIYDLLDQISIALNFSEYITSHSNDINAENLDFSDIENIDFNKFNSYINENPCSGFYISQFPEVRSYVSKIKELISNEETRNEKFPLGLFEFRIFSRVQCIQFQIPSDFPNEFVGDFQEFLFKEISKKLITRKYKNFSNFIGLLLSSTPNFITEKCYSEHLRNIILNLITHPKEPMLKQEIMKFFKKFLPTILNKLGSPDWNKIINEELKYENKGEVISFLTNPWRFALERIKKEIDEDFQMKEFDVQKAVKAILGMINNLTSDTSIEQLIENVKKDETDLQDKLVQDYRKVEQNNEKESETEKELNKQWIEYSKYIKSYLSKIPSLPITTVPVSAPPIQGESSFDDFYDFFSQKLLSLPTRKSDVLAIIPRKSNTIYTLSYKHAGKNITLKFFASGKVMLFIPPKNSSIQSLNLQCEGVEFRILSIQFDIDVVRFKYSRMENIRNTYEAFSKCYQQAQKEDFKGSDRIQIIQKIGQVKILFGDVDLETFIEKLKSLNTQHRSKEIKNLISESGYLDKLKNDVADLEKFTAISFSIEHMEKPHATTNFLSENLSNIISSVKINLDKSKFDLFSSEYQKKHEFFTSTSKEFQILFRISQKFLLKPNAVRSYNVETSNEEMDKIEASEHLLTPSIFKNGDELNVTIKKIDVNIDPLIFGVDLSPIQIRLGNFTEEEIICEFQQINEELPLPKYHNEVGFLIIEIPVESLCKDALVYAKNDEEEPEKKNESSPHAKKKSSKPSFIDIEKTFEFDGVISLKTREDPNISSKISYSIKLRYISLTAFVSIKNDHFFAFNDEKTEIVPFLAGSNSKLIFEKFLNKDIKNSNFLDNIFELKDNKAKKPDFKSTINQADNRIIDISTQFIREENPQNASLSANIVFGLTKEKSIPATLHINTIPKRQNNVPPISLAIYSDKTMDFESKDALVNIGNLGRKVYFFFGTLNNSDKPIKLTNVTLICRDRISFIQAEFDPAKNNDTIPPNKYGYAIYFFEVKYTGHVLLRNNNDTFNANLRIEFGGETQDVNFKYKVSAVQIQESSVKYCGNKNNYYSYDYSKQSFIQCNIGTVNSDPIFRNSDKQILMNPYCYSIYDKTNSTPKVEYDTRKGFLTRLFYDITKPDKYEVFGFFPDSKKFMVLQIDRPEKIGIREKNVFLFARIKDQPNTFFPLLCPVKNNSTPFNLSKDNYGVYTYRRFYDFLTSYMMDHDRKVREVYRNNAVENLLDNTPIASYYNLAFVVDFIGKGRRTIPFREIVSSIVKFTNCLEFKDHFDKALENCGKSDSVHQFYSFTSALNELISNRYDALHQSSFYLQLPIPIGTIRDQQQLILKSRVIDEDKINDCRFAVDYRNKIKDFNETEQKNIKQYQENGFTVTPILKWTESNGISPSTIEELDAHKDIKIKQTQEIKAIKNQNSNVITNDINFIDFPDKITISSLYDKFSEILASTYILTFNIYSLKTNHKPLNRARTLLNQLIAVFFWQNQYSGCFPFSSFTNFFIPAFSSMMNRLYNSKLKILNFPIDMISNSKMKDDFVQIPSLNPNIRFTQFTQPGISNTPIEFQPIQRPKVDNPDANPAKPSENAGAEKDKASTKKEANVIYNKQTDRIKAKSKMIQIIKRVDFVNITENTKEIPDTDFIQYMIQEMLKQDINFTDEFTYNKENDHIPESLPDIDDFGTNNVRIDSFMEASKKLTDTLLTNVNKSIDESIAESSLLNKKDSIYASILIDCTSTLSSSYKSGLVTLAISLCNALTAIKIPYSIVLFCDSDFQYVLKRVDQSHDLIHFEKLLDTVTVRRRMSDMSAAILMAREEIESSDKNRTNHAMFVLTDGLTYKVRLIDKWKNAILNDPKISVMFYFLDVLNKTDQDVVHPLWDNFRDGIKNSKSPNSVLYSKTTEIYNGDISIAKSFYHVLNQFSIYNEGKDETLMATMPEPIDITPEFLTNIIKILHKEIPDETKFFSRYNFANDEATQYTQIDLNLVQPNPLEAFTASVDEKNPENIIEFLKDLTSCSLSLFDQSLSQEIGTLIFPPNKPSQFTPSIKGSIFYFPGLIKFILTQGQDSKIFLEKKAGLIRSYSVFFVIDCSISCINPSTVSHAFQTIYTLLYPLSKIDIPSLNIIITTENGPYVLCSEKPTMIALDDNSPLWASLFAHLLNPHPTRSCFYSALMNAYQMRIQQKSASSILFSITDGFYSFNERNKFNSIFESFKAVNTTPITVGIGSDPSFIDLMTEKSIWAQNPRFIWPAVLYLFGKDARTFDEIKTAYSISRFSQEVANQLENYLNLSEKTFPDLFNELNHKMRKAAIFSNYYNKNLNDNNQGIKTQDALEEEEDDDEDERTVERSKIVPGAGPGSGTEGEGINVLQKKKKKKEKNRVGDQFDLGKKGYYKGVNILIVMCWDCTCSPQEDPRINEYVLRNGVDSKRVSLVNALSFFAIQTKIVKNYIDAINELTSGKYNQVWIICGRKDGKMPGNNDSGSNGSNLINQFIDCVIQYWHLGGGVVFWTDNYPLTAEANIFLSKAKFTAVERVSRRKTPTNKKEKTQLVYENYTAKFHIGGSYPGAKMLHRINSTPRTHHSKDTPIEEQESNFDGNENVSIEDGYEKSMFNRGLKYIFEGYTIASAIKGEEKDDEWQNYREMQLKFANTRDIYPFRPFSLSSDRGFSSLYYVSPMDCKDGDVIIDCGFSKLFFELTEEGIDRYVKNIAIFMLQLEKKEINYGGIKDPRLVRPEKFRFEIDYDDKVEFHNYSENRKIDLVFLVDGTGSMRLFIEAVANSCNEIARQCKENFPGSTFRFGAVVYRDTIVSSKIQHNDRVDKVEKSLLNEDPDILHDFFSNVQPVGGGGDGPEDWVSGYQCMLTEMNWNADSARIVIHICDAPGHGKSFTVLPGRESFMYKIPYFIHGPKSYNRNKAIYDEIQNQQDIEFTQLVKLAAREKIMFFCMNGNKRAMYCFSKTKELYDKCHGKKFVIQNQFGFGYDEENNQEASVDKNDLVEQVKNIALQAIDIAVAVSGRNTQSQQQQQQQQDDDDEPLPLTEYEKQCNENFNEDMNKFELEFRKRRKQDQSNNNGGRGTRGKYRGRGNRGASASSSKGSFANSTKSNNNTDLEYDLDDSDDDEIHLDHDSDDDDIGKDSSDDGSNNNSNNKKVFQQHSQPALPRGGNRPAPGRGRGNSSRGGRGTSNRGGRGSIRGNPRGHRGGDNSQRQQSNVSDSDSDDFDDDDIVPI